MLVVIIRVIFLFIVLLLRARWSHFVNSCITFILLLNFFLFHFTPAILSLWDNFLYFFGICVGSWRSLTLYLRQ